MGNRLFDSIKLSRPKLNKFDLSHERKMSMNMGDLVPFMCQEILPGDRFRVNTEIFMRLAPMLAPVMHRVNVYTHYFFVPNRLVWSEWEDFITGGRLGTSAPVFPFMKASDMAALNRLQVQTLADFLGLPTVETDGISPPEEDENFSALPFRAYQLIYDEYYRDQNVTAALDLPITSGDQAASVDALTTLRKRAWEKDYFTSALPFAQRGPAVGIPFGDAQVTYLEQAIVIDSDTGLPKESNAYLGVTEPPADGGIDGGLISSASVTVPPGASGQRASIQNIDEIAVSGTINELRRSMALQRWLEKNARGGARYVESNLSHFGVKSSDGRLQRPEYLGGGKTPVVMSEVLSTFQSDDSESDSPIALADMAGRGVSTGMSNRWKRGFEEHGYVIGIISVLPKTAYQQGIPKHFQRFDKLDFAWPLFANIGEQEVLNKELFYDGNTQTNPYSGTFGYQSRYAEYKYGCSTVHGEMKTSLAFWHMGRIFTSQPELNQNFIEADPTQRIFNTITTENDKLWVHLYNRVDALRPLPYYGTPI